MPQQPLAAAATRLAGRTLLVDEFLAREADRGRIGADAFTDAARRIHLHGHCHQKALGGMEPTLGALGLLEGVTSSLVDSACCGMAGSFGFEAEHYEVSRAMGERTLFPAILGAPDAEVLVTGVSCRQQIGHFTGRTPRHVAELLAEALDRS